MDGGFWPPEGGSWEGGCTTKDGTRWVHVPWEGWQEDTSPRPFIHQPRKGLWSRLRSALTRA